MNVLFVVREVRHHSPIGVMQLSAAARNLGHATHLAVLSRDDLPSVIAAVRPKVVAYSGCTGEHKHFARLNAEVRHTQPDIVTVMGGPHATFFPAPTLSGLCLDAVCIGEGERAFEELLRRVEAGKDVERLDNILTPGMAARGERPVLHPLIADLDSLPFPDRALFFEGTENGRAPVKNFMISRGCPYECAYCFNSAFKTMYRGQRYVRRHSVDYVLAEIQSVRAEYPLQYVKFYDDIFTFGADSWLEEFARRYQSTIGLPFYCLTRADLLTRDTAVLLKEAGCHTVQMAVESVNDRIRNGLLRRNMTRAQLTNAFALCRDLGLTVVTNYVLGLPTSSIEDDVDAVYFNIAARVPVPEFPIFQPYPGTELGELCLRNGWFDGDCDSIHASYNHRSLLTCFSEAEKDTQRNVAYLGQLANTLAATDPAVTDWVMTQLIYQPPLPLYADLYARHKWELYNSLVYPIAHDANGERFLRDKSLALGVADRVDESGVAHVDGVP